MIESILHHCYGTSSKGKVGDSEREGEDGRKEVEKEGEERKDNRRGGEGMCERITKKLGRERK